MSSRTATRMAGQLGWALWCVGVRLAGSARGGASGGASGGATAANGRATIYCSPGLPRALCWSLLLPRLSVFSLLTLAMFPLLAGTWMWITMWAWRRLGGTAHAATDRWPPEQAPPVRRCGTPLLCAAGGCEAYWACQDA